MDTDSVDFCMHHGTPRMNSPFISHAHSTRMEATVPGKMQMKCKNNIQRIPHGRVDLLFLCDYVRKGEIIEENHKSLCVTVRFHTASAPGVKSLSLLVGWELWKTARSDQIQTYFWVLSARSDEVYFRHSPFLAVDGRNVTRGRTKPMTPIFGQSINVPHGFSCLAAIH